MNTILFSILVFILGLAFGIGLVVLISFLKKKKDEKSSVSIVEKAKKEADRIKRDSILEYKEEMHKLKAETDKEIKEKKSEIKESEERLLQRENNIDRRDVALKKENG